MSKIPFLFHSNIQQHAILLLSEFLLLTLFYIGLLWVILLISSKCPVRYGKIILCQWGLFEMRVPINWVCIIVIFATYVPQKNVLWATKSLRLKTMTQMHTQWKDTLIWDSFPTLFTLGTLAAGFLSNPLSRDPQTEDLRKILQLIRKSNSRLKRVFLQEVPEYLILETLQSLLMFVIFPQGRPISSFWRFTMQYLNVKKSGGNKSFQQLERNPFKNILVKRARTWWILQKLLIKHGIRILNFKGC